MSSLRRIITVGADHVDSEGFFYFKSKPKSPGYGKKLAWLRERFDGAITVRILDEGERSVGSIGYLPGEPMGAWSTRPDTW